MVVRDAIAVAVRFARSMKEDGECEVALHDGEQRTGDGRRSAQVVILNEVKDPYSDSIYQDNAASNSICHQSLLNTDSFISLFSMSE